MVSALSSFLTHFAAGGGNCADQSFLGLWPWYHYLQVSPDSSGACVVTNFTVLGAHSSILLILLALVDDLLRVAGVLAVGFVIYAGVKYITSQGDPSATAQAQSTLINSLAGLAIALVAIGVVSFIGNQAGGGAGGVTRIGLDLSVLPNPAGVNNQSGSSPFLEILLSWAFRIIGAVAFLVLVIGGLRYVLSQGDPQNVNKAKNMIMYALIGLVVAIVAQSIVSLVINKLVP